MIFILHKKNLVCDSLFHKKIQMEAQNIMTRQSTAVCCNALHFNKRNFPQKTPKAGVNLIENVLKSHQN